jgi:hypothetical protein
MSKKESSRDQATSSEDQVPDESDPAQQESGTDEPSTLIESIEDKYGRIFNYDKSKNRIISIRGKPANIGLTGAEGSILSAVEKEVMAGDKGERGSATKTDKEINTKDENGTHKSGDPDGGGPDNNSAVSDNTPSSPDSPVKDIRIVLGPSGIGKTYFSENNSGWTDGDKIIDKLGLWPKELRWWEDDAKRIKTEKLVIDALKKWLDDNPKGKITSAWFIPGYEKQTSVIIPSESVHKERLAKKGRIDQPGPDDWPDLSKHRDSIIAQAKAKSIPVFSDFNAILKPTKGKGKEVVKIERKSTLKQKNPQEALKEEVMELPLRAASSVRQPKHGRPPAM